MFAMFINIYESDIITGRYAAASWETHSHMLKVRNLLSKKSLSQRTDACFPSIFSSSQLRQNS